MTLARSGTGSALAPSRREPPPLPRRPSSHGARAPPPSARRAPRPPRRRRQVRAPPVTTAAKDRRSRSRLRSAAYSVGASFAIPLRDDCEAFFLFLLFYCIISKLINAQNPARGLGGVRGAFLIIAVKKKRKYC
jgi:hypothetical protein